MAGAARPAPHWPPAHARRLAPWLAAPLALAVITGITYRVGRTWLGMDKETGHRVLEFHTGEWIGETTGHLYATLTGLGPLFLIATGLAALRAKGAKNGRLIRTPAGDDTGGSTPSAADRIRTVRRDAEQHTRDGCAPRT